MSTIEMGSDALLPKRVADIDFVLGDVRMGAVQAGLEVGDHVRSGWHPRRSRGARTKQPGKPVRTLSEGPGERIARHMPNHCPTPRPWPTLGQEFLGLAPIRRLGPQLYGADQATRLSKPALVRMDLLQPVLEQPDTSAGDGCQEGVGRRPRSRLRCNYVTVLRDGQHSKFRPGRLPHMRLMSGGEPAGHPRSWAGNSRFLSYERLRSGARPA